MADERLGKRQGADLGASGEQVSDESLLTRKARRQVIYPAVVGSQLGALLKKVYLPGLGPEHYEHLGILIATAGHGFTTRSEILAEIRKMEERERKLREPKVSVSESVQVIMDRLNALERFTGHVVPGLARAMRDSLIQNTQEPALEHDPVEGFAVLGQIKTPSHYFHIHEDRFVAGVVLGPSSNLILLEQQMGELREEVQFPRGGRRQKSLASSRRFQIEGIDEDLIFGVDKIRYWGERGKLGRSTYSILRPV